MTGHLEIARLRGLRTAWWRSGNSSHPILLFLHGFPDSPETWQFQAEHFQSRYEVICPYTRGAGPSENSSKKDRFGLKASALDLLQVLNRVDPEGKRPIYCVGHDLGAVHASNLALYLGDRLKGLVLMNGLPLPVMARRINRPHQLFKSWYIYFFQMPRVPELAVKFFPKTLLRVAHQLGEIPESIALQKEQVQECLEAPLQQYREFAKELPRALRNPVPSVNCPVLVLWGEKDAFLAPPNYEEFRPFAAHFTCRILPGNHWLHRVDPQRVNRLLGEFFENRSEIGALSS